MSWNPLTDETDSYEVLQAELKMVWDKIPEGHIGVNLEKYLTYYEEMFDDDKCCRACCAAKSFRRLEKAQRAVSNVKHAAAVVIQRKLFWNWYHNSPVPEGECPPLRQPNDPATFEQKEPMEFEEWTGEELKAEVLWYREEADRYSSVLLQMHGYDVNDKANYVDVNSMSRADLIQEIQEQQDLINDCKSYLENTQEEYEEDMKWRDLEWRKLQREEISALWKSPEKQEAYAEKNYPGGFDQYEHDMSRIDNFNGEEKISDDFWYSWIDEDREKDKQKRDTEYARECEKKVYIEQWGRITPTEVYADEDTDEDALDGWEDPYREWTTEEWEQEPYLSGGER